MTLGQAVALLETVESGTHRLAAYVVLSLLAGVRTEEARAITWDEVDFTAGTVAIYRSARVKGDTKTRKSRRVLKVPTKAVQALRQHHARKSAERLAVGEMWQEHDLVFCREDGTRLDRWHVRKELGKITEAARLGGAWTPRELRHSRSCPSSARTMPAWRTLPTWSGTAARRSPRRSTVTRSSPPSPKTAPAVNRAP